MSNGVEAIEALKNAVGLLCEKGRFSAAANNQKQIAEMYETDVKDPAKAKEAYESAAEWYSSEDSKACVVLLIG
jgi:alpha-soluble NSF attachment protein